MKPVSMLQARRLLAKYSNAYPQIRRLTLAAKDGAEKETKS